MAINKISEFPKVTPSADDKILIEKNGEGGHINLSEMPVSKPVNTKITGEVNSLKSRIDNLVLNGGNSPDECVDARRNDNTSITYPSLKARLDAEHSELKGDLSRFKDLLDSVYLVPEVSTDDFYTNNASVSTVYYTDRIIPSGYTIDSVKWLSFATSEYDGKIFVVNESNAVIDVIPVVSVNGWNEKIIGKVYNENVKLGFYKLANKVKSGSNIEDKYRFCEDGLYQSSDTDASIGDIVTIAKSSSIHFAFALQFGYRKKGDFEKLSESVDENTISFVLDRGNILKYKEIDNAYGLIGRWYKHSGYDATNNDGAELYFKVKNTMSVTMDIRQITETSVKPYIAYSIDGADFVRQQITNKIISLPDESEHIVRIVIDGMNERLDDNSVGKWYGTHGVYINEIIGGTLVGIVPVNRIGMFFGDSITEGVNALGTGSNAEVNSAINSFPWFCCKKLGAVSHRVGYGATGLATYGSFRSCIFAIDYFCDKVATPTNYPDFIVINHGINDRNKTETEYITAYEEVIRRLNVKYPCVPIFCVVAYSKNQYFSDSIREMCNSFKNCYFVSSAGWDGETTDGTHLSVEGAKNNGEKLADEILKVLGKSFFI